MLPSGGSSETYYHKNKLITGAKSYRICFLYLIDKDDLFLMITHVCVFLS